MIQDQKVFLTQKFVEGHVIKVGMDYKSSAFLLNLHSCIIKEQLAYETISNAQSAQPASSCFVETRGLIGVKFEEVPVLAHSTLQKQSEGDLFPCSVAVFHMTSE